MNVDSRRGRWFFISIAALLLVIIAVGFARSFYLRSLFHNGHAASTGLPIYLVVHGIVLTLWFLLFLVQTLLASSGRIRIHRSLGIAGAVLAAVVFSLSLVVVVRSVPRETALVVIGDMIVLILFAIFISMAIRFRRKPEVHKRLMTIASISIVAPAIARWPGAQATLPLSVILPQLSMLAAQVVYDVRSRRRMHPATAWGVAAYLVALGITLPLASSKLGHTLVNALR